MLNFKGRLPKIIDVKSHNATRGKLTQWPLLTEEKV